MEGRAKELFLYYRGNRYFMDLDGDGAEYASYRVPKETERAWAREAVGALFSTKASGTGLMREYAGVAGLLEFVPESRQWNRVLFYPMRTEAPGADGVTVLFMLGQGPELLKKGLKDGMFTLADARNYREELIRFADGMAEKAEKGTLTRCPDYTMNEFSDPVYVSS